MNNSKKIVSFRDLEVYRNTYNDMLVVAKEILPNLPPSEKFDLKDQLSRSTKTIPRLIAEGYAKRHQKMGFQKYLDDAMAESNETVVSLCQCRDLYGEKFNAALLDKLIDSYDKSGRQIYKLKIGWTNFKLRNT